MIGFAGETPESKSIETKAKKEVIAAAKKESPEAKDREKVDAISKALGTESTVKETQKKFDSIDQEKEAYAKEKEQNIKNYKDLAFQADNEKMSWNEWGDKYAKPEVRRLYDLMKKLSEEKPHNMDQRMRVAANALDKIITLSERGAEAKKADSLGIQAKIKEAGKGMTLKGTVKDREAEGLAMRSTMDALVAGYRETVNNGGDKRIADVKLEAARNEFVKQLDASIAKLVSGKFTKPADAPQQIKVLITTKEIIEQNYRKALMPEVKVVPVSAPNAAASKAPASAVDEQMLDDKLMSWEQNVVKDELVTSILDKDEAAQKSVLEYWNSNGSFKTPADLEKRAKLINEALKKDPKVTKHVEMKDGKLTLVENKEEAPVVPIAPTEKEKATLEKILKFLKELLDAFTKGAEKGFMDSMSKYVDVGVMKSKLKDLEGSIFKKEEQKKKLDPSSPDCIKCEEELAALKKEKAELEKRIQEREEQQKKAAETAKKMNEEFAKGQLPLVCTTVSNGVKVAPKPNCPPKQAACAEGQMQYVEKQAVKAGAVVETPRRAGNSMFITVIDRSIRINGDNNIVNSGEGGMRGSRIDQKPASEKEKPLYTVKRNNADYRGRASRTGIGRLYDLNR